jgi:hypothetical protein
MPAVPLHLAGRAPLPDGSDDQVEALVYRYAADRGEISSPIAIAPYLGISVPATICAVTRLVELRLLRTDGERLVPVAPGAATAALVSPIERAIYERLDTVGRLRERIKTIVDVSDVPAGGIDVLSGIAEIRGLLKLAADGCRDEVVVLRPAVADETLLDDLLNPCYGVLDRDTPMRLLCSHRSRAGFASRALARWLTDQGAQIRTLGQLPQAVVVFDRSVAVLLGALEPEEQPAARQVRDPDMIRFLLELFEHLWDTGTPFSTEEAGYAEATDDLQQCIVRLLAQGLTDEVVARRLGMSVRTCRRHIATLLQTLDSVSRFQAGFQAANRFAARLTAPEHA